MGSVRTMGWFMAATMCVRGRRFGTVFRRGGPFWRPVTVSVFACRLLSVVAADDRARPHAHIRPLLLEKVLIGREGSALDVQTSVREMVLVQSGRQCIGKIMRDRKTMASFIWRRRNGAPVGCKDLAAGSVCMYSNYSIGGDWAVL